MKSWMFIRSPLSTVGVKVRPTPIVLELDLDLAVVGADGDGKLAAGQEVGGVARERDERRLGQRARDALLLEKVEEGGEVDGCPSAR